MARDQRMLDLKSGGWLILLAAALMIFAVVWMVVPLLRTAGNAVGNGHDPATYGFDLDTFTLPRNLLVASGFPKDGIHALDAPPMMPGADVPAFNEAHRGKYLVSDDLVIGVVIGGEARAYPVRVLNWHEIANDTVGGVPIAVTWHPLCGSAIVFDRRIGGETLTFGVSGLLYDSNLLMFDRRDDPRRESLWCQLRAEAVAGPAAGRGARLRVLPASLAHWRQWLGRWPGTVVVRPDEAMLQRYQRDPYGNYLATGEPRFPVEPLPPADGRGLMSPVVEIEGPAGGTTQLYDLEECGAVAGEPATCDPAGRLRVERGDRTYGVLIERGTGDAGEQPGVIHALWFSWYALRGAAPNAGSVP